MIKGLRHRPHELVLLRRRATLWNAADVLGMSKLMAFLLPANWDSDSADGYRAACIGEALASRDDWDVEAMAWLQLDVISIPWREIRDTVLAARASPSRAGTVTRLLADWDGRLAADSAAATVFELLVAELASRLAHAKAPHSADWALGRGCTPLIPHAMPTVGQSTLVRLLRDQPWPQVIAAALETVQHQLTTR